MTKPIRIYALRCIPTGDCYVGSTTETKEREARHKTLLRHKKHHSRLLQEAWDQHGADAFVFDTLEVLPADTVWLDRREREAAYVQKLGNLNSHISTDGKGFRVRPDDAARYRKATLERIAADPNYAAFLSERGRALVEMSKTDESRLAMAAHTKRRWQDPETAKELRKGLDNRWANPNAKAHQAEKMRAARAKEGVKEIYSEGLKAAWADPNSGLRNRSNGRWNDPEAKARQSEKLRAAHARRRAEKL